MNTGFTFIEIKTTGFNATLNRICYIALTQFDKTMRARRSYSTWINPEEPLTRSYMKLYGMTNKDFQEFPKFKDVIDIIYPMIEGRVLGTFHSRVDIIEFLREELFMEGIRFKYLKKDFIIIKNLEEAINKKTIEGLTYKYLGRKLQEKENYTKETGDIFKQQCEIFGENTEKFKYSTFVKNDEVELVDKFFKVTKDSIKLNFGKYKGKDLKEVNTPYIEWILSEDFPAVIKEKITDYLK